MNILAKGLGGLCAAALALAAAAAGAQTPAPQADQPLAFVLKEVGPGVWAAIDGPAHKAGSNAGFVIGDDGVLVIDSTYYPDVAKALLAEIRKRTDKPVRYVVNTHYHLDHVAGDGVFRQAGAIIITHRNARGWLRTENFHLLGDKVSPERKALIESLPLPDVTTDKGLTVWLGARKVVVQAEAGHTGGDLTVAVPDAKVLFTGDLLWRHTAPNVIDGTVKDWIRTVAGFQSRRDATTIVPGHGDVATAKDVADFESYLSDLSAFTKSERSKGETGDALVAAVTAKMKKRYGDWTYFDYFAAKEIGFMDAELAGTKRIPKVEPDQE